MDASSSNPGSQDLSEWALPIESKHTSPSVGDLGRDNNIHLQGDYAGDLSLIYCFLWLNLCRCADGTRWCHPALCASKGTHTPRVHVGHNKRTVCSSSPVTRSILIVLAVHLFIFRSSTKVEEGQSWRSSGASGGTSSRNPPQKTELPGAAPGRAHRGAAPERRGRHLVRPRPPPPGGLGRNGLFSAPNAAVLVLSRK